MRKLIYAINLTIDGCFDHTNMVGGEDLLDYYTQLVGEAGLFVYGRKTYELMGPRHARGRPCRESTGGPAGEAGCVAGKVAQPPRFF